MKNRSSTFQQTSRTGLPLPLTLLLLLALLLAGPRGGWAQSPAWQLATNGGNSQTGITITRALRLTVE